MSNLELMEGVTLREVTRRDAHQIYEALSRHREYFSVWLPFAATLTLEGERQFLESVLRVPRPERNFSFVIQENRKLCGMVGFVLIDRGNRRAEIGYWLLPEYQHRGIMTAAVRALCRLAFEGLGMNRVQIRCAVGNTPSNAIPQRLEFWHEGVEREGELMASGRYVDLNLYSMLLREWVQKGGNV